MMKHYAVEDWVQLAKGRAHPALEREMREHIASGCEPCAKDKRRWIPAGETSFGGVRTGQVRNPLTLVDSPPAERFIPVRLLHDSAHQAPFDGVRAAEDDSRHLLYEAGSFIVDINLEVDRETGRVSLAGQILHRPDPLGGVSDLRVFLVEENGESIAETSTNEVGEFVIDFDVERRLRLALVINDKRAIVIPSTRLRENGDA